MQSQLKHGLVAAACIWVLSAGSAQACNLGTHTFQKSNAPTAMVSNAMISAQNAPPHEATAVGLWQSTFTGTDGSVFVGFETIYADGNELLIDNSAPATDNVCSGVWEQTGPRTYTINHPSWDFDMSGNLIGIVTLISTITVDPQGNKYTGHATVTVYDPSLSTVVYQTTGTLSGSRITAKSSPL
jgi:hypothetical protein